MLHRAELLSRINGFLPSRLERLQPFQLAPKIYSDSSARSRGMTIVAWDRHFPRTRNSILDLGNQADQTLPCRPAISTGRGFGLAIQSGGFVSLLVGLVGRAGRFCTTTAHH